MTTATVNTSMMTPPSATRRAGANAAGATAAAATPQPRSLADATKDAVTLDGYIKAMYPPPLPGTADWYFYHCWGYEEWIKVHTARPAVMGSAQDMESLRVLQRPHYLLFLMMRMLDWPQSAAELETRLAALNLPIIRTTSIVEWPLLGFMPRGLCGIQVWLLDAPEMLPRKRAQAGSSICYFPYRLGPFGSFMGDLAPAEFEPTGMAFKRLAQLDELRERGRTTTTGNLERAHIRLPGRDGIWLVLKAGPGHRLEIVPVEQRRRKGKMVYTRIRGAAREQVTLSRGEVANVLVLDWLEGDG